jgi:hypothetical protein
VPNGVGKMNTKVYTGQVLPQLLKKFNTERITLCQDADSVYRLRATIKWAKDYDLDLLTLPGSSPDLLIMESLAHPIKKKFHTIRVKSKEEALGHFTDIWDNQVDQEQIAEYYNWYTKRLHECKRADEQMT